MKLEMLAKQLPLPGVFFLVTLMVTACGEKDPVTPPPPPPAPPSIILSTWTLNNVADRDMHYNVPVNPSIRLVFSAPVNRSTTSGGISLSETSGNTVPYTVTYGSSDSILFVTPSSPLKHLEKYKLTVTPPIKSVAGGSLTSNNTIRFNTSIDSSRKFPLISDDSLLTLVQKQTFKYFWDFAHPVSGLARERNTSGETVTSGGSGFGIMAIVTGIHRGFITRAQGLARMQTIVGFLRTKAQTFHGAFPHWLNGTTGAVQPFSALDNGADLVETSYLMQGLLTARQYFTGGDAAETTLRSDINTLWNAVEWSWFRKGSENKLYWHWSPSAGWAMNMPVSGYNEALITYVMAASSTTYSIPKIVYDEGWARAGAMKNGALYMNIPLPLGPAYGGPLFFAHYSFLGINPRSLTDAYANYETQNRNHSLIHYEYSKANPRGYFGYSDSVWGLTASDVPSGYAASSPTSDIGVIAPTAALSSFPYTPVESMKALKFYYYVLGDKIWKDYGFVDAFSLHEPWFATSFLAIDQGPNIIGIENHRSQLLWNLFMSAPEVKAGLRALGFQSPFI